MHRQSCPGTLRLLGVVFAVTVLVVPGAFGQPLRATVVHVEGVPDTWHVTDKDGKIVEVHVPTHSLIDIQTSQEERPGAGGTSGQGTGTVLATVVAVDTLTNRVKVQTQAGQVIELETSTKDRQIGEQVTLIVPR
jgi:diaminopimelate epimerase